MTIYIQIIVLHMIGNDWYDVYINSDLVECVNIIYYLMNCITEHEQCDLNNTVSLDARKTLPRTLIDKLSRTHNVCCSLMVL